jgi:hypothetical protein
MMNSTKLDGILQAHFQLPTQQTILLWSGSIEKCFHGTETKHSTKSKRFRAYHIICISERAYLEHIS